jgi:hypothetical protein
MHRTNSISIKSFTNGAVQAKLSVWDKEVAKEERRLDEVYNGTCVVCLIVSND